MQEISVVIDDEGKMEFKTKGFNNPIEIMMILGICNQQLLTSLKVRSSGVIKPSQAINQAFSKDNNNQLKEVLN